MTSPWCAAVEHRLRHVAREVERTADPQVPRHRHLLQRVRRVRPSPDVHGARRYPGARRRGDQVMGVELKVKDVDRAEEIAEKLEKALAVRRIRSRTGTSSTTNLFTALNLQKLALVIILTLIIVVAASTWSRR